MLLLFKDGSCENWEWSRNVFIWTVISGIMITISQDRGAMLHSSGSIDGSCQAQCSSGDPVALSSCLLTALAVFLAYGPFVKHSHREETHENITPHLLYSNLEVRPVISFHSLLTRISHMVSGKSKCAMKYEEAHRYVGNNWTLNIAAISDTQSHFKACQ